jgi:hypothetical protein
METDSITERAYSNISGSIVSVDSAAWRIRSMKKVKGIVMDTYRKGVGISVIGKSGPQTIM